MTANPNPTPAQVLEQKPVETIRAEWEAIEAKRPGGNFCEALSLLELNSPHATSREQNLLDIIDVLHTTIQGYHSEMGILLHVLTEQQQELERLRAQVAEERWIPVSERLPEDAGLVLAWNRHVHRYAVARVIGQATFAGTDYFFEDEYGVELGRVTHWQPLPAPPAAPAQAGAGGEL